MIFISENMKAQSPSWDQVGHQCLLHLSSWESGMKTPEEVEAGASTLQLFLSSPRAYSEHTGWYPVEARASFLLCAEV